VLNCYYLTVNIEDLRPYQSAKEDADENLDSVLKASRSLVEAGLQGHFTAGPVGLACIGLAGAVLTAAGRLMVDRAAASGDPKLAGSARAISGLGHAAGVISAVDSAIGVVQDPIDSAVNSLANISSDTPDPAQLSRTLHHVENTADKLLNIENEAANPSG